MKRKKMRVIKKAEAENLCRSADMEGLSYAIQEGYLDAPGTNLGKLVDKAKILLDKIENKLQELKEKYDIEDS